MWEYPEKLIYATSIHKTKLSNLTQNEIVLPPKHGGPPPYQKWSVTWSVFLWYDVENASVISDHSSMIPRFIFDGYEYDH